MIFIDTGAFIARYLEKDEHHTTAIRLWDSIAQSRESCYTSNFILDETLTLLGRWVAPSFAIEKAHLIYSSPLFTILRPDYDIEIRALELFKKYADQKVSFTDCVSFALMKAKKIKKAFSFDQHFQIAGFTLLSRSEK